VKQHLAAIRMLFDWLVVGQVLATNPASSVRGPKHSVRKGKTPVLAADEARTLLDSIDTSTHVGLRDRALIGLMVYTFARVGAALGIKVEDVYVQSRRTWVRLHEKGGKQHEMPCHHNLMNTWRLYKYRPVDGNQKHSIPHSTWPYRAAIRYRPMSQADAYRMIHRRATDADILTRVGNHSFRATGITEYLRNGGKLEVAQQMAAHRARVRPAFMIGVMTKYRSMRLSES
jgi:site-specific recombinase XerD